MITALQFITLNTGDITTTSPEEVDPILIEKIKPLVKAGKGVAGPFDLRIDLDKKKKIAIYTFYDGENPIVNCTLSIGTHGYNYWRDTLNPFLTKLGIKNQPPMTGHYLAVTLLPAIQDTDPELVPLLGDAERCLAWAIVSEMTQNKK